MADSQLPLEDLLGFMDDDERVRWDSGIEEQRAALREELTALWYDIPDPTFSDLEPPYMHANDWSALQNGSKDVFPFYFRQWKRQRKAEARAELEKAKAGETPLREPTVEELRPYVLPNERGRFDDPATPPSVKSRIRQAARRKWIGANYPKPPERFLVVDKTPAGHHEVRLHPAPESPEERALRKREELLKREEELQRRRESEQTQTRMRSWMEQMGFTPVDELPPQSGPKFATIGESDFSEPEIWGKLRKLTESNLFWGGGVGLAVAAYGFLWAGAPRLIPILLLILAWLIISFSVYKHRFFEGRTPLTEVIGNAVIYGLVALVFIILWVVLVPPSQAQKKDVESRALGSVSPSTRPVYLPSPTALPTRLATSPSPVIAGPPGTDAILPLTSRNEIPFKGGDAQRLADLMRADGYLGPTLMAELYVKNNDTSEAEMRIGTQEKLTSKNSDRVYPGERMDYKSGANTETIYIMSEKGGKIDVSYRPR